MKHCLIPDTQIYPKSNVKHIQAAANYLSKHKPNKIIIIGDWWDMPSLSTYDKAGDKGWEDKDVQADIDAGWEAMLMFLRTLRKSYMPEIHFCVGNHEDRITRASNAADTRIFSQYLNLDKMILTPLRQQAVKVHKYLEVVKIDGVCYSHYFVNPASLFTNPIGGTIESKLKNLGHSFSMGHQQQKQTGEIYTCTGKRRRGLVCGRFYPDYHSYLGAQKNSQSWSGILLKHEVKYGDYDLMEVSMKYLLREYCK